MLAALESSDLGTEFGHDGLQRGSAPFHRRDPLSHIPGLRAWTCSPSFTSRLYHKGLPPETLAVNQLSILGVQLGDFCPHGCIIAMDSPPF